MDFTSLNQGNEEKPFGASGEKLRKLYSTVDDGDSTKLLEIKEIELEEFYIQKLKEQRHKMEMLKNEFEKKNRMIEDKDSSIQQLKSQVMKLQNNYQDCLSAVQEYKNMNDELQNSLESFKDSRENELGKALNDKEEVESSIPLKQAIEEVGNLRAELSKMMNVLCEMDSLKDSNTELELDLRRLKSELKRRESQSRRAEETKKELEFYKRENDLLRKDLESANDENAQLRIFLKKQETTMMDIKKKSKDDELKNSEFREKALNLEYELEELVNENYRLKGALEEMTEKASDEKKYRTELEEIKINLLSVRNNEFEKINEMFESMIKSEDSFKQRTPQSRAMQQSFPVPLV